MSGSPPLHRIEVRPRPGQRDVRAERFLRRLRSASSELPAMPSAVRHASVYLIEGSLSHADAERVAHELLADPVTQVASLVDGAAGAASSATVEVHPLPGVTDPAAESVELAVLAMTGQRIRAQTAERYDLAGVTADEARVIGERLLANTVIHAVHTAPFHPERLPVGRHYELSIREVPLASLDDTALERLSREAHLFLSLEEMRAIRDEYRRLGREPREIELETLAQTWSEHCVHKTLKSTIRYRETALPAGMRAFAGRTTAGAPRPGHEPQPDGSVIIHNLLKSTVAAATHELMAGKHGPAIDWCLSVFVDNAGVIAFDAQHAVCFKVETHNHPSAIEPYGGAATGIGGCIRDVMGTGLVAKPIAATDVFCVAPLHTGRPGGPELPRGCLPPARILEQVVSGVRDYGNRMGIPTLNGAVWFDERHIGNPLVYCGTVGVLPRDRIRGSAQAGDRIVALGGRTGRDGIHGATFSSAELTDTHADEFGHAVQIGNAITEKKCLDVLLAARDHAGGPLFHAVTDCGAGGFSSAVGEMGSELGAEVHLDRAPLKYDGLSPTEVWISEAQERMVLAVAPQQLDALRALCDLHEVEMCELGTFGTPDRSLRLLWHGTEVGRLDMHFLHDGIPTPTRDATWDAAWGAAAGGVRCGSAPLSRGAEAERSPAEALIEGTAALLAHPNIASRAWIIRQYDHEVQGGSVLKPIVGPGEGGPGDAAVILPVERSEQGLAVANGLATGLCADPYLMGLAAIDECVRNLVCVGADPTRIAILDNFCWPSCRDERNLGSLVRAAEACYDGAVAYRTPFISGKDSLNNQFVTQDGRVIQIPPTLLISGLGIVPDASRAISMDLKRAGNLIVAVGVTHGRLGGSHWLALNPDLAGASHRRPATDGAVTRSADGGVALPEVDLVLGPRCAAAVARAIAANLVRSAHDASEGGLLVALAEMAFAGELGCSVELDGLPTGGRQLSPEALAFAEDPSRYLLEVEPGSLAALGAALDDVPHAVIGRVEESTEFTILVGGAVASTPLWRLREAWTKGAVLP
ncbi:MAG: hypothetical protein KF724_12590 [Phycisphaeraceae bacterium]|nr:hypothetical protein [Phycisphaeraceae bacterium]